MLGYDLDDLENMISSVESILTTVNSDDDPWMHNNLFTTKEFLSGLLAEGYFD